MSHATDDTPEAAPPAPEVTETPPVQPPRRARKFTLPDHHVEEGVGARIEAFLDGPPAPRRRGRTNRVTQNRPLRLDSEDEWSKALRHEAARQARYGRPTAIVLIDLRGIPSSPDPEPAANGSRAPRDGGVETAPAPGATGLSPLRRLIDVIAQEVRETDRARRTPTRIFLMLPETTEDEAANLAARIERGYRTTAGDGPMPAEIRLQIAVPRRGADPRGAIDDADRRLDDLLEAG